MDAVYHAREKWEMHKSFRQKSRRKDSLEDLRLDGRYIKMYLKDVRRVGVE
jgi:hypothetical protein